MQSRNRSGQAIDLIQKVIVSQKAVEVQISSAGLEKELGTKTPFAEQHLASSGECMKENAHAGRDADAGPLHIVITSHLLRCGKQVKLVLGHDSDEHESQTLS